MTPKSIVLIDFKLQHALIMLQRGSKSDPQIDLLIDFYASARPNYASGGPKVTPSEPSGCCSEVAKAIESS